MIRLSAANTPVQDAIAVDRGELDQRWAQYREWLWQLDYLEAMRIKKAIETPVERSFAKALGQLPELERIKCRLAQLAFDELVDRCMQQTIGLNEDPQAANADAVGEEQT